MNYESLQQAFWNQDKSSRRAPHHPVVRAVFEPMAQYVASSIPLPHESSILDVGCGNGFLQFYLEKVFAHVVGLDFSSSMLAQNPCKNTIHGDCRYLPFADKSFDVVCTAFMLHHLEHSTRHAALREMKRVARRAVVVFEPNRNNILTFLFAFTHREERGALEFSRRYLQALMAEVGLNSTVAAHGWLVPNKSPCWSIPLGRWLNNSFIRRIGFNLQAVARL
jgi:SAM-dependent methyltransferase